MTRLVSCALVWVYVAYFEPFNEKFVESVISFLFDEPISFGKTICYRIEPLDVLFAMLFVYVVSNEVKVGSPMWLYVIVSRVFRNSSACSYVDAYLQEHRYPPFPKH